MKINIYIFLLLSFSIISCQDNVALLSKTDTTKNVKMYFISSEIMGPNTIQKQSEFQKKNQSFYIDNKETIEKIKDSWVFPVTKNFDNFSADYYLTYTEDDVYKGKISIDLNHGIAISGYGPTLFDNQLLEETESSIKTLKTKFFEFSDLMEARSFHEAIKNKKWLLPSPNDEEYYKWLEFNGESIIQVNNKKFARDIDINKAFEDYMPLRFPAQKFYYNIFRFTSENSSVRICSNKDLSDQFPEEFHVIIPWKKYNAIILPLINFDEDELSQILLNNNIQAYKIIDKIE